MTAMPKAMPIMAILTMGRERPFFVLSRLIRRLAINREVFNRVNSPRQKYENRSPLVSSCFLRAVVADLCIVYGRKPPCEWCWRRFNYHGRDRGSGRRTYPTGCGSTSRHLFHADDRQAVGKQEGRHHYQSHRNDRARALGRHALGFGGERRLGVCAGTRISR